MLTLQLDTFVARLVDFAIERHGPAPVPWAWLALGSAARREFTLGSDQDNALAYADAGADDDAWFEQLARVVNDGLVRCGFGVDANSVVASDARWRMTQSRWLATFRGALEHPDRSGLIRATVAFDFRAVAGGLDVVAPLTAALREAPQHPDFVRRLGRTAVDFKPPLGFRGSLPAGSVDLKRGATIPISNVARFLALAHGITISSTLDRLVAAEETGAIDAESATALREAFVIVFRARLEHHARQIEAGDPPDNEIVPAALPPLARVELREALRAIAHVQRKLSLYAPLGL